MDFQLKGMTISEWCSSGALEYWIPPPNSEDLLTYIRQVRKRSENRHFVKFAPNLHPAQPASRNPQPAILPPSILPIATVQRVHDFDRKKQSHR